MNTTNTHRHTYRVDFYISTQNLECHTELIALRKQTSACCIQMSDGLTGTPSLTDICHPPICQWPLLAIFSSVNCSRRSLPSCFFVSGIRGALGPKDAPASADEYTVAWIQNRHTRESYKWHTRKCHVSTHQIWSKMQFHASNGDFVIQMLNFQLILSTHFASYLVLVDNLDQTNDSILLPLCTVTKDKEHRGVVVKATWL